MYWFTNPKMSVKEKFIEEMKIVTDQLLEKMKIVTDQLGNFQTVLEERNDIVWQFLLSMDQKQLATLFLAVALKS